MLAVVGMFAAPDNQILFDISVGYLVSMIFWLLVVQLPSLNRRRIMRANLKRRYQHFKENTIQALLWASIGTHDSRMREELCDHRKFREFFDANKKEHWYASLNGLEDKKDRLKDIQLEMELLAEEVSYVLDNADIQDEEVHAFFGRLKEHIFRLRNDTVYTYDPVKYVAGFLWSIHARWNIIEGQMERDVIDDMIHAI